MKISKTELQQIIKEEADRFLKIKALKEEKARIQRELNENYSMEEEEETFEEGLFTKLKDSFIGKYIDKFKEELSKVMDNPEVQEAYEKVQKELKNLSNSEKEEIESTLGQVNESIVNKNGKNVISENKLQTIIGLATSGTGFAAAIGALVKAAIGAGMYTYGLPVGLVVAICMGIMAIGGGIGFAGYQKMLNKKLEENHSIETEITEEEEVLATSTEEEKEEEEENMNEEEVLAVSEKSEEEKSEEENIEEGIMDWFSKSENKEEAKAKMCDKIKEMVNAHDKMSQSQKDSLLKQCDKIAEALLAKGNAIFKKEPLIKFYPRQNSYAIIAVDAKPDSKWVELLQNLVKGASEDLKGRGLAESIRAEVERLDKVKELKNKANSLIENLKKL
jgi:hypothetical protein